METSTVWLSPSLIHSRFDANYNSPLAVATRAKLRQFGETRVLDNVIAEMRCGPFGSTIVASEHTTDGDVILIQPTDISSGGFTLKPGWKINKSQLIEKGLSICPPNSLLFARKGIYAHCAVLPPRAGDATLGSSMIGAVIDQSKADAYFLEGYFRAPTGNIILSSLQMITASPTIGTGELVEAILPYPRLEIQKSIGHKLRVAEQLRVAAMSLWQRTDSDVRGCLTGLATPQAATHTAAFVEGDFSPRRIDADYYKQADLNLRKQLKAKGFISFGSACESMESGATPRREGADVRLVGVGSLRTPAIKPSQEYFKRESAAVSLRCGDILLCNASHDPSFIGKLSAVVGEDTNLVASSEVLVCRPATSAHALWIVQFLNTAFGYVQIQRAVRGMTAHLYAEDLAEVLVPSFSVGQKSNVDFLRDLTARWRRSEDLTSKAFTEIEELIDGKLDEDMCLSEGRELANEFGLEVP